MIVSIILLRRFFNKNEVVFLKYDTQELQFLLSLLDIINDFSRPPLLNTWAVIVSIVYWLKQIDQLSCSVVLPSSVTGTFSYVNVTLIVKVEIVIAHINKTVKQYSVKWTGAFCKRNAHNIYTYKPLNNIEVTSLTAWKTLQANGGYVSITKVKTQDKHKHNK